MRDSGPGTTADPFTHTAFVYDSERAYLGFVVPFLCAGLERGEAVAVAASDRRIAALRTALGHDADAIRFVAAHDWYVRPVRTLAGWSGMLTAAAMAGKPSARLVGENPFGAVAPSWIRGESATNTALAPLHGHLLCPYDRNRLPRQVIDAARRTHQVLHDGGWQRSDDYVAPERLLTEVTEPMYPVHGPPAVEVTVGDTVAALRGHLRDRAAAEGWLEPDRVEMLLLAVTELATNGIRHGGDRRRLRVWVLPDAVVGEVADDGGTALDPLAGFRPPVPGVIGGMGLWLVQQISDAFAVHARDGITRARFALRR